MTVPREWSRTVPRAGALLREVVIEDILMALLARRLNVRLAAGQRPQIEMGGRLMVRNGLSMMITPRT